MINTLKRIEQAWEIRVIDIDKVVIKKAYEVLLKFAEHKISFTAATTDVLYKELAIDRIFTLDKDFKKMRTTTSF